MSEIQSHQCLKSLNKSCNAVLLSSKLFYIFTFYKLTKTGKKILLKKQTNKFLHCRLSEMLDMSKQVELAAVASVKFVPTKHFHFSLVVEDFFAKTTFCFLKPDNLQFFTL